MTITVPLTTAKPSAENKCAHDHIRRPRHRELKFGKQALPKKNQKNFRSKHRPDGALGGMTNSLRPLANGDARQFSMKSTKQNFTRLSPNRVRGRLNIAASWNSIAVIVGVQVI
jgi:hypothetical protein